MKHCIGSDVKHCIVYDAKHFIGCVSHVGVVSLEDTVRCQAENSAGCFQAAEAAACGCAVPAHWQVHNALTYAPEFADMVMAIVRQRLEAQASAAAAEAEKRAEEEAALAWAAAVALKQQEDAAAAEALEQQQVASAAHPTSNLIP